MKKTQIFIFAFNRPDLLEKQISCFKKFFVGEYETNVICDCRDEKYVNSFENICKNQNIKFYKHENGDGQQTPSMYHGITVTWAYEEIILKKYQDDYALLVDHDMFLIDYLDMQLTMKGFDVRGCTQFRGEVKYIWPGLTLLDIQNIKDIQFDFLPCVVKNQMLDTGGGTFNLLNNCLFGGFDVEYPENFHGLNLTVFDEGYGFELHLDGKFLHFRNACGWHNQFKVFQNSIKNEILNLMVDSFLYEDGEDILMKEYRLFSLAKTEINEHLPTLHVLAKQCESIVEFGVCHGKSTRALLASGTKLRSYDVWIDPKVLELFEYAKSIGRDVDYIKQNSIKVEIEECDMLFIDSWHHYYQLRKELKLHANKVKKYIVFHDTVSCGSSGEDWNAWGNGSPIEYEKLCYDLDTDKIDNIGINSAIFEFLSENYEWRIKKHYKHNNGLTILEKNG